MAEDNVLIHVWDVDPKEESSNIQRLDELFAHEIGIDPWFVSARILVSDDRTSIAAVVEMRSVEDLQHVEQLPEVRETLEHLNGAANVVLRLYEQVKAYSA